MQIKAEKWVAEQTGWNTHLVLPQEKLTPGGQIVCASSQGLAPAELQSITPLNLRLLEVRARLSLKSINTLCRYNIL